MTPQEFLQLIASPEVTAGINDLLDNYYTIHGRHIEGLLHLGAISVVSSIAYLGLDRFRHLRDDPIEKSISNIRTMARDKMNAAGIIIENMRIKYGHENLSNENNIRMLCDIAKERYEGLYPSNASGKFSFVAIRMRHYPGLLIFENRLHIWSVRLFGSVCALMYFYLVMISTWDFYVITYTNLISFCSFSFLQIWVVTLVTGGSGFARRLERKMEKWLKHLDPRLKEFNDFHLSIMKTSALATSCPAYLDRTKIPIDSPCPLGSKPKQPPEFCPEFNICCPLPGANFASAE